MKTLILGGGTYQPVANHLALCAPAFGTTAKRLSEKILGSELVLTKMADPTSSLMTNEDVDNFLTEKLKDEEITTIILSVAFCDFKMKYGDFHGTRFKTENGNITLELTPTEKVIKKIRLQRPDIFLVGFKTTTNETIEGQFLSALKMMKSTKCNLVLANDTVNRRNIIITPEESYYGETTNRENVLNELVEILTSRQNATYNRTNFILGDNYPITKLSNTFQTVVKFLIDNGGFLENNGNGFTPGHFCQKISDNSFVSSQRKANHNLVFENGMSLVEVSEDDKFTVTGTLKASVGARSQWLLLNDNKDYDCIIHTHNPAKLGHVLPITPQKPFQCGSLECGLNTLNHLRTYQNGSYDYLKAVYLEKHGANILFKSTTDPNTIIDFIKNNLDLGIKVK